ncbi:putative MFS family arabinose efflux permease [Saccharothrix ecbatanensis]|uniref:Putative MFS family arabinose efflux permease n=1 Tax=Saccharothrix ecbatanensis TaxID=1105145 RepID=A0A7W9M3A5_9PSEU|nr:MFS transporter [Saccharothrix ecbatanensis]MBB5805738.1 putative MFS family arabinose efflux permease [Saccharothrix ecbatanensis]
MSDRTIKLLHHRDFVRFWTADTVSLAGTHVTTLALQAVAILTLGASLTETGTLAASRWLPYLLFGLVAGVLVDRRRRLPVLIGADFARAAVLALIPLAAFTDTLTLPLLFGLVVVFGTLSLFYDAAHQSFLPLIVPTERLTDANARLEQTGSVAQGLGPLVGGALVKLIGGPLAILVDAVSYLISGLVLATLRTREQLPEAPKRDLRAELREGLRWVYGHKVLRPLAIASHAWFLFTAMVTPVFSFLMLNELGFDALDLGITYAVGGVGGVLGASVSSHAGRRFGVGPVIVAARWLTPVAYALVPFATSSATGFTLLCAAQFLFWLSATLDSAVEMGYRQTITPARLLGRSFATMRSVNRASLMVGALVGGVLAEWLGIGTALWIAVVGLVGQAVGMTFSAVRHARL